MSNRIQPFRCAVAGALAGLASLVPGVSGGTMILAVGAYPRLVGAVADLGSLRFRSGPLASLGIAVGAALAAMFLVAGTARDLIAAHPVAAFGLFLGLAFGGVPVLLGMSRKRGPAFVAGAAVGLFAAILPLFVGRSAAAALAPSAPAFFAAGVIAAFAMTLPGISGSFLLLLMGMYRPFLDAADRVGDALRGSGALLPAAVAIAPFALGIVLGVVLGSRLVRYSLEKHPKPTLGLLLGLLLGATAGLWPFRTPSGARFAPAAGDIALALGAIGCGFALTALVGRASRKGT